MTVRRVLLALAALFAAAFCVGYRRGKDCTRPDCVMCARANQIP